MAHFRREMKLINRMRHENVVAVVESGEVDETPYLATNPYHTNR